MQLFLVAGLAACALPGQCYTSQRHFVLNQPYDQVVARLVPVDNQRKIYAACDADLEQIENQALELFPLPLRLRRRTRFRLQLPLVQSWLESIERVELTGEKMTVRTHLAQCNWKVRQLDVMIVLTRDGDQRTHVSTYCTMRVNGLGRRLGWLFSDATLQRLECGLNWATQEEAAPSCPPR